MKEKRKTSTEKNSAKAPTPSRESALERETAETVNPTPRERIDGLREEDIENIREKERDDSV